MRALPLLVLLVGVSVAACKTTGTPEKSDQGTTSQSAQIGQTATNAAKLGSDPGNVGQGTPLTAHGSNQLAAFAGGCFWGTEDLFRQVPGVTATAVGYTGGKTEHPSYESVCSHTTGHAETVLVEFDPAKVTYEKLLSIFMENHNPTTMNRQGPDVGDQYRSEVFTFNDAQVTAARTEIANSEKRLGKKVVTKVEPLGAFWKAEEYHQQYDEKSGTHSCPIGKFAPKGA